MVIFSSDNGHEIYYTMEGRILKPVRNMETGEFFDNVETKYYSELAGDVFDGNDGMAGVKRSNWEGGVRIPLIVKWPGKIKEGITSNALVANYDLLSTMADLVNYELPVKKDGISYLPELTGEQYDEHDYVVYSSFMGPALVSNDGWKIRYFAPKELYQLYYLPNDYREENNLIEKNREKAEELIKILKEECNNDLNNGWFKNSKMILPAIKK